jgi:hypothetical protein
LSAKEAGARYKRKQEKDVRMKIAHFFIQQRNMNPLRKAALDERTKIAHFVIQQWNTNPLRKPALWTTMRHRIHRWAFSMVFSFFIVGERKKMKG